MQVDVGVADAVVRRCNTLHVGASLKMYKTLPVRLSLTRNPFTIRRLPLSLRSLFISSSHQLIPHFVIRISFLIEAFLGGS